MPVAPAKIPIHVRALRAFLENENRFFANIKKLVDHADMFENILPDYDYFRKFIKPLEAFVEAGNYFEGIGEPSDVDEDNFFDTVDALRQIICVDNDFALESIAGFATLAINYKKYINLLQKQKKTINQNAKEQLNVEQKKFLKSEKSLANEFLDNNFIQPVQRIGRYHLEFKGILDTLPVDHNARPLVDTIYQRVRGLGEQANEVERTPKPFGRQPSGLLHSPLSAKGTQRKFRLARVKSELLHEAPRDDHSQALPFIANLLRFVHYYTEGPMASGVRRIANRRCYGFWSRVWPMKNPSAYSCKLLRQLEKELIKYYFKSNNVFPDCKGINDIVDRYLAKLGDNSDHGKRDRVRNTLLQLKCFHSDGKEFSARGTFSSRLFNFSGCKVNAENFIQRSFLAQLYVPFRDYSKKISTSFWRRIFTTDPEKIEKKNQIMDAFGQLITVGLDERKAVDENLWNRAITLLRKATRNDQDKFSRKYTKGDFGKAFKQVEAYLEAVNPGDQFIQNDQLVAVMLRGK